MLHLRNVTPDRRYAGLSAMKAMILKRICMIQENSRPLEMVDVPVPTPGEGELLIRVSACGVCHTELDEIEGRILPPVLPIIPGHQVIGRVTGIGKDVRTFKTGDRIGVGWIHTACGQCPFCMEGRENLCPDFKATGRDVNGGYAEYMTVSGGFVYPIPDIFSDAEAAPLLCAGAIGYRSLRLTGIRNGQTLGLTGFGASAHLVLKMVRHLYPQTAVFVFARSEKEQRFARDLGAVWAGNTDASAPDRLHAIIDTTPAWQPVVEALRNLESGGRLVINAIRKEEADKEALRELEYPRHLWLEKEIKSVANVTRRDIAEFLKLAADIPIRPQFQAFPLTDANRALAELKAGNIEGAKVLSMA
jgi:alcohol dehydrogenase, propanol-preferring